MDIGNNPDRASTNKPRTHHFAGAKKAASWLGRVTVAQLIAHFVRNWLS